MEQGSLERPSDVAGPGGDVRRWIQEIELAEKREEDWRKSADKILDRYRQKDAKKHSFNILYSNTETLLPAVYNKPPKPDVRRRFKDSDPVAKAAAQMMERALEYSLDAGDWHQQFVACTLDMLLPGRAVARIRYVPSLSEVGTPVEDEEAEDSEHEADEGSTEELEWQQVECEHVLWDDFLHGPGRTWEQVPWVAFRHRLTRDELVEKFGKVGESVGLDKVSVDKKDDDDSSVSLYRTAEVWEIWCKDEKEVYFLAKNYRDKFLKTEEDPLRLQGFFPVPRPLYAFPDSADLTPVSLYSLYKEQAEELDRVTGRINRLVDALRARGVYDSVLSEMPEVFRAQDNDFIPLANASAMADRGGLEKAIWFMPITEIAGVLEKLYVQREQVKQTIYEITGISDILRGATQASETATAQQIKNQWGTLRLQRTQREVQRFIRDLLRLAGEVIGQEFLPETITAMTGVKLPSKADQMQAQMAAKQAQMMGQQPPPQLQQLLSMPSMDDAMALLKSDLERNFRVDIETDSTVADATADDMKGLADMLQAMQQTLQTMLPAVQAQAMPMDAVKGTLVAIVRRARLGIAVEDAIDQMQPPQQQPDPRVVAEQQKAQMQAQQAQADGERQMQLEQQKMQMEAQAKDREREHTAMIEKFKIESKAAMDERLAAQQQDFDRWKAQLDADTKIMVAQISASASLKQTEMGNETTMKTAAMAANAKDDVGQTDDQGNRSLKAGLQTAINAVNENITKLIDSHTQSTAEMMKQLTRKKTVIRGADGRIAGVQ